MRLQRKQVSPGAFLSYVRFDDKHEDGKLSDLRDRLSAEVRAQTGDDFPIFQDRNDIHWGENWEARIEQSLDASTFLILIITPSFFKSTPCKKEVQYFLDREKKLQRNDLILPVYYIELPADHQTKRENQKIAKDIFNHQYVDWRELRFELITSPQALKTIAQMATEIRKAISRPITTNPRIGAKRKRTLYKKNVNSAVDTQTDAKRSDEASTLVATLSQPVPKSNIPVRIVDQAAKHGTYPTILKAVEAASPGERILIRPGTYEEQFVIDKPLELIGDGAAGEIIIHARKEPAILFKTSMGRMANLKIIQSGGENSYGIRVVQGRPEIEDCEVIANEGTCISIAAGADPRIRRNRLHGPGQFGIIISQNSLGMVEHNDIFEATVAGIGVGSNANPIVLRNRIHDVQGNGIHISMGGAGLFEDNEIVETKLSGVIVRDSSKPVFRRNQILRSQANGVWIYEGGAPILEANHISQHHFSGISVVRGGSATCRGNVIATNRYGVEIDEKSGGTFENNDLRDNEEGGWHLPKNTLESLIRSGNFE